MQVQHARKRSARSARIDPSRLRPASGNSLRIGFCVDYIPVMVELEENRDGSSPVRSARVPRAGDACLPSGACLALRATSGGRPGAARAPPTRSRVLQPGYFRTARRETELDERDYDDFPSIRSVGGIVRAGSAYVPGTPGSPEPTTEVGSERRAATIPQIPWKPCWDAAISGPRARCCRPAISSTCARKQKARTCPGPGLRPCA